jgi:uncharacterized protein (DUF488 family)
MKGTIFTIGFTQKRAEDFFRILQSAGVRRVVDVRLHNTGQLAGFTKRDDLSFFLRSVARIEYIPMPLLAPQASELAAYRSGTMTWADYASTYIRLLAERRVETELKSVLTDGDCFLCSEATAEQCHRRVAVEYLQQHWSALRVIHL